MKASFVASFIYTEVYPDSTLTVADKYLPSSFEVLTHSQRTLSISILHLRGNWTHACCCVQPFRSSTWSWHWQQQSQLSCTNPCPSNRE